MTDIARSRWKLENILRDIGPVAVAVSGGVDSLTLATAAHRTLHGAAEMFHAVSPAVPQEATARVRSLAAAEGWQLSVVDAGEFADANYRSNPVNRCFYCKTNLYGALAPHTRLQIVAGTNLDDLGEYRPGLKAAEDHGVRHPFVEAEIDKQTVRAIARDIGLRDIAELPSAPCLSSRIETGIAIDPVMLELVHAAELLVSGLLAPRTVRCRVRAQGVVIELDEQKLAALNQTARDAVAADVGTLFRDGGFDYPVRLAPYRTGSAFLVRRQRDAAWMTP
jgi:uncharacterized protein